MGTPDSRSDERSATCSLPDRTKIPACLGQPYWCRGDLFRASQDHSRHWNPLGHWPTRPWHSALSSSGANLLVSSTELTRRPSDATEESIMTCFTGSTSAPGSSMTCGGSGRPGQLKERCPVLSQRWQGPPPRLDSSHQPAAERLPVSPAREVRRRHRKMR